MRQCEAIASLFLLVCVVSCSGEASEEQKYISAGADFISRANDTITGRYYSIGKKQGQPSTLKVLHIKSFSVDRVVYDLVEYEFNPMPSGLEMMNQLGSVSVSDPDPEGTIQRRRDRLPKPYALTKIVGIAQKGIDVPLTMDGPNERALSCYSYTAVEHNFLRFEFCEGGYRGVNADGAIEFRRQEDPGPLSIVAEVLAANPGFPDKVPDLDSNKNTTISENLEHQDVTTDIQFDGEIIGSAFFCMGNMGLFTDEEARKVGTTYIKWLRMKYGNDYMNQFFYIFKDALIAGEKKQQNRGMQDCDERIATFDDLAKVIGYERPRTSSRE